MIFPTWVNSFSPDMWLFYMNLSSEFNFCGSFLNIWFAVGSIDLNMWKNYIILTEILDLTKCKLAYKYAQYCELKGFPVKTYQFD